MMPKSVFFSKNNTQEGQIVHPAAIYSFRDYIKSLLPVILLIGITVGIQGCAANKCDCPKFGGHHLKH